MDLPDIVAAVAPKPMFISQEIRHTPGRSKRWLAPVCRAYQGLGATDRLTIYNDNAGKHRFIGEPAYQWIESLWPVTNRSPAH